MSPNERPTLSVAETAALLGISRWLVQQAVRDGSLPSLRLGRRILIPRARLLGWLEGDLQPTVPTGTVRAPRDDSVLPAARNV